MTPTTFPSSLRLLEFTFPLAGSYLGECLSSLFDKYQVGSDAYLRHLFAAVRGLGAAGRCVIVGRGANFLLPAETTLRVRLVALPEDRAREVARRLGVSIREAGAWVRTIDCERSAFCKLTFKENPAAPHHYDLVVNTSRLWVDEAADVITETLRRFERRGAKADQKQRPPAGQGDKGVGRAAGPALA
jgi:Cytidylate kinase-like family